MKPTALKEAITDFKGLRKDTVWYLEEEPTRRKIVLMMLVNHSEVP